jgi:hypothetical protein
VLSRAWSCHGGAFSCLGLAKEIEFCRTAMEKAEPHERITRMIGLGGGFQLHGLLACRRTGR